MFGGHEKGFWDDIFRPCRRGKGLGPGIEEGEIC